MNRGLFLASEAGDLDEIQRLHKQNRDVLLERTYQRDTALHIASRNGHLNVVKWILAEEPSLAKARNKVRKTPLHEAAKIGNLNLVKFLLQHKQSFICHFNTINLRDNLEFNKNILLLRVVPRRPHTPLMIASQYRHLGIVELLLEPKSSEYRVTTSEWYRSISEAAYRGYEDMVVVLLDKKAHTRLAHILHRAVEGGHLGTVVALLNHSSWRNELMTKTNKQGRCAVHVAAMNGHWEMIKEFRLRMPDSLEIRCPNQKSLLHLAIEYHQFDVAKYLLENVGREKAEEMVCYNYDCSHNTPLHWASTNGVSPQVLNVICTSDMFILRKL